MYIGLFLFLKCVNWKLSNKGSVLKSNCANTLCEYIVKLKFRGSTLLLIRCRNPKEISEVKKRKRGKKSNEKTDTKANCTST